MKQLVQLLLPCFPIWLKNKKITDLRLSITSTLRTPVGLHGIYLTTSLAEPDTHAAFASLRQIQLPYNWLKMEYMKLL